MEPNAFGKDNGFKPRFHHKLTVDDMITHIIMGKLFLINVIDVRKYAQRTSNVSSFTGVNITEFPIVQIMWMDLTRRNL